MLTELAPGVHFFGGAVGSFIVENGAGGALIADTGLDESHARKLLSALAGRGLSPSAILNTHSHADHHGGNAFILRRFPELPVYAPPLEAAIINHPLLEPLYLFGACPPPELQTKFLLAPASPARPLSAGAHTLGGAQVELLDIPGHAVQMVAVRARDVLYAADGLFGEAALHKHPLTFCVDSAVQKRSARQLAALEGVRLVQPAHGEATADLAGLAQLNLAAYERTTQATLQALRAGLSSIDDVLAEVCRLLQLQMTNPGALLLNRSVVSAHLTELAAQQQVSMTVQGNRLGYHLT